MTDPTVDVTPALDVLVVDIITGGPVGPAGPPGPQGESGLDGATGPQGDPGQDGTDGTNGAQGPQGPQGPAGTAGATGPAGAQGPQGPAGTTGATGPQGPAGSTGSTGAPGAAGPGVAAGGTTGQVLTKTSATDYATNWQTPSAGGGSAIDPGHAYGSGAAWWYIPGNLVFGQTTKAVNANFMSYYPWFLQAPWTFDTLGLEVTTAGAGLMRVGIYNADAKWQPSTLVLDAGTFDVSTLGVKTKAITALTLQPGRYIVVAVDNVNTTIRVMNVQTPAVGVGTGMGASPIAFEWYRAFTYAALPADGTTIPWTNITYSAGPYFLSGVLARMSVGGLLREALEERAEDADLPTPS